MKIITYVASGIDDDDDPEWKEMIKRRALRRLTRAL
jgi:hypothetical protein